MTAFDDILNAEKEALHLIEVAKLESAELVANNKIEQRSRVEKVAKDLVSAEQVALEQHQLEIAKKTNAITSTVEKQVAEIVKKFSDQADSLKKEIIQSFSR